MIQVHKETGIYYWKYDINAGQTGITQEGEG